MSNWAALQASLGGKKRKANVAVVVPPRVGVASQRPAESEDGSASASKRRKKQQRREQRLEQQRSQQQRQNHHHSHQQADSSANGGAASASPTVGALEAAGALDERRSTPADVAIVESAKTPSAIIRAGQPRLEAARLRAIRRLSDLFQAKCHVLGGRKHFAHFESWLWAARSSEIADTACLVVPPIPSRVATAARTELMRKLTLAGMEAGGAAAVCDSLEVCCAELSEQVGAEERGEDEAGAETAVRLVPASAMQPPALPLPSNSSKRRETAKKRRMQGEHASADGGDADASGGAGGTTEARAVPCVHLACGDTSVVVSEMHLQKLRTLHATHHDKSGGGGGGEGAFLAAAYCVLARLHTLQGGHDAAGGMQGACPPAVFDTLRADFGVAMEVFASPLNCRFPRFCSAGADVDGPFGSAGSFFGFSPTAGAFLANPPFDPPLVSAMARRMGTLVERANARGTVLTFIVVIPTWPEQGCWRALKDSQHTVATVRLPSSKHAYIDGGQHHGRRAVPLRLSNHDSSVFFLMSQKARAHAPLTFAKERRLREAFTGGMKILGQLHK